jgi:hypothetical protein
MIYNGEELNTIGDIFNKALSFAKYRDKEGANNFLKAYASFIYNDNTEVKSFDEALKIARNNFGYYAGYFDTDLTEGVGKFKLSDVSSSLLCDLCEYTIFVDDGYTIYVFKFDCDNPEPVLNNRIIKSDNTRFNFTISYDVHEKYNSLYRIRVEQVYGGTGNNYTITIKHLSDNLMREGDVSKYYGSIKLFDRLRKRI